MAEWFELEERDVSVSATNPSVTLKYLVLNAGDDEEIDNDVRSSEFAPTTYMNLSKLEDYESSPKGGGVYAVEVHYGTPTPSSPAMGETPIADRDFVPPIEPADGMGDDGNPPSEDDLASETQDADSPLGPEWSFDTSGGTAHITQSLETISSTKRGGGAAPDFKRAIGVQKNGGGASIDGVDVGVGKLRISRTTNFRFITLNYLRELSRMTFTTNDAAWFTFERGESLFVGASGSHDGSEAPWKITHNFEISLNETNILVCDGLTVPSKRGHQYIWAAYSEQIDGNDFLSLPNAAYVERVYRESSFRKLGI